MHVFDTIVFFRGYDFKKASESSNCIINLLSVNCREVETTFSFESE